MKKKKYEPPKIIDMNVDHVQALGQTVTPGQCNTGPSAETMCQFGNMAYGGKCQSGSSAGARCQAGSDPGGAGGKCQSGGMAFGGMCKSGTTAFGGRCDSGTIPAGSCTTGAVPS